MCPGIANNGHSHFLNGWKEIANYLGKGIRTVQRYELHCGLPVRRPSGHAQGAVVATPAEIDIWVRTCQIHDYPPFERANPGPSRAELHALRKSLAEMKQLRQQNRAIKAELLRTIERLHATIRRPDWHRAR
ncbi:MAG TPA: hypothetical protein VGS27_34125 [Candidatus Sulfotelmatobacter sp.]|nr:hypothetical protein [Candidatus Sulfotelmatobacter sp.]